MLASCGYPSVIDWRASVASSAWCSLHDRIVQRLERVAPPAAMSESIWLLHGKKQETLYARESTSRANLDEYVDPEHNYLLLSGQ